ncbi:response regulator transcription factor [Streptomyces lushanensis]|uniref:response regulator transcription factor n=1 Tax=Streptomyces lushanensis TaxID=1434255 RepID=UPI000834A4F7|nr:response regulator transcription factor [Streptomyces lushanensis]
MPVRVLIAEDVSMLREALVTLLELECDLEIVAAVGRGDAIVPTALRTQPDVAVIDISLPGIDGLSAAMELHRRLPNCRTIMLTGMGRSGTLRRALDAKVSGFLLKDSDPHRLAQAIRAVAAGQRAIDPELALSAWDVQDTPLTRRELEVLRLAAQGAEADEIARRLYLSKGTVRNYLTSIVTKLNARNRVDAIRIAEQAGWIP